MTDQEIIKSIDEDENTTTVDEQTNVEQTTETPVEEKPVDTPSTTPVEEPKQNVSDIDKYDQMVYSFKRQINKLNNKLRAGEDWQKKYEALEKRIHSIENPEKPLLREQFETDDKFIDGLVQQRFDKMWEAKQAEMQEQYEKYLEEQRQEEEHKRELDEGINHWFPTQEERKKYVDTVQNAFSAGLAELLEQEQNVLSYLHQTENSSILLYEFATNPKVVNEIFQIKNPLMRLMAVRDLEMKLVNSKNTTPAPSTETVVPAAPTNPAPAPVNNLSKPIGKPGAIVEASSDIFNDDDELTRFVRSH